MKTSVDYRRPDRALTLRSGDLNWLRFLEAENVLMSRSAPDYPVCVDMAETVAAALLEIRTALSPPPFDTLRQLVDLCSTAHRDNALRFERIAATVLFNLGRYQACYDATREALQRARGPRREQIETTRVLARAALELGDEPRAATAYRNILDLDPDDAEAARLLGVEAASQP